MIGGQAKTWQIFHPTKPLVIGILDWELCTLGSPLADLGNLLLPFSFPPVRDEALLKELSGGRGEATLLVGLKGLAGRETGLPERDELENWWVEGMQLGLKWHKSEVKWDWPIAGMG
jgi:aminoglycoside phosphotransferase (APT) family kinase protein